MIDSFPLIKKEHIETLQINIGLKCNQACKHCHVNSSPLRTEKMSYEIISLIPKVIEKYKIKTLDITGGAPEMHPEFRNLITTLSDKNIDIIDRCNLTIFFEDGFEDLPQFLAKNNVIVTASLPCYEKDNVELQRGYGVFDKSINALKILNDLGYGKQKDGLQLNLVYNPVNPVLPPSQVILEEDYKRILFEKYNISFNNLYTITNMPINRYADSLNRENKLDSYYKLLKENFNKNNLENLMCKKTISVNWQGQIYDCDFNQQINLKGNKGPKTLSDLMNKSFKFDYGVSVKEHCFACTAGAGSSCGGTLT
jgi:radical SAM/Cys-rich protein